MSVPRVVYRPRVTQFRVQQRSRHQFVVAARGTQGPPGPPGSDVDLTAHLAAPDPHPQYTTTAEASAAAPVQSVAGRAGAVTLAKADVGLGSVDNTADASKPVSTAQASADAAVLAAAVLRSNHTGTQAPGTIAGGAASAVACFNGLGVLVSYSGIVVDQTNGRFGIGVVPAQKFDLLHSFNGNTAAQVVNPNAGSAAQAIYIAGNGTSLANYGMTGTGYAGFGSILASTAYLYSNSINGLAFMADNGAGGITWSTGGPFQRMALTAAGNLAMGLGSTSNKFDIRQDQNSNSVVQIVNAHAGGSAQAVIVTGNGTDTATYGTTGTGWIAFGSLLARMAYLYTTRTLCLMSEGLKWLTSSGAQILELTPSGKLIFNSTMTPAGTVGARTINLATGSINIAAGGSSVVLTNSLATTTCIPFAQLMSVDATAKSVSVTRAGGTVTFTLNAAATAEVAIGFLVVNA